MRKELKRYSSIGNRNGILLFCSKILTGEWEDIASIRTSCSFIIGVNLNFYCAEMLFEDMGLINIQNGVCRSTVLVYDKTSENSFINELCSICFKFILNESLIDKDKLKFDEERGCFYIPTTAFHLDSAIIRNILKELSALELYETKFYIAQGYERLFTDAIKEKKNISQKELLKKLENEQKMGEEGEQFVIEYERRRLNTNAQQSLSIKQISIFDVSAGYDIISYHDKLFKERRYIEVKTYLGKEHFHWSANEIRSAKLRGKDYFLYLINYSEINNVDYTPLMIENPYVKLQVDDTWSAEPDSFFFEKVTAGLSNDNLKEYLTPSKYTRTNKSDQNDNQNKTDKAVIYSDYQPNRIPLYSLKAACGRFEDGVLPQVEGWIDISGRGFTPDKERYFAVHAKGNSMSPTIKDGDLCVFEWYKGGSRNEEIVLTMCRDYDTDFGGPYTIKKYHSEKVLIEDSWHHAIVVLIPLNPDYLPIELDESKEYKTIGVLKCVL